MCLKDMNAPTNTHVIAIVTINRDIKKRFYELSTF